MNKKIKCIDLVSYAIIKAKYGGFFFFILAFITSCVCYQYIGKTFEWKERDEKARWCVLAFLLYSLNIAGNGHLCVVIMVL